MKYIALFWTNQISISSTCRRKVIGADTFNMFELYVHVFAPFTQRIVLGVILKARFP